MATASVFGDVHVGWASADAPGEGRADGVVWAGLVRGHADACAGSFRAVVPAARPVCTHGPDPAGPGVDVRRYRSTEELLTGVNEGTVGAVGGSVPCYGDGASGKRVQAVYAYASDVPDRSSSLVDAIGTWAGNVDKTFADSAAQTGGVRHVRWVTDASCRLSVLKVRMSPSGDDDYSSTVAELQSAGLTRTDRKYLVWVDANRYCGVAELQPDDSTGSRNASESGPSYARVDNACWGLGNPVEAHELMHTLGGVQYSAPHTSGGGHCTDEYDRMCYTDGQGVTVTYPCAYSQERLFDCGHDDYFHTNPPPGSYLASKWNTAMSSFLERLEPSGVAPSPGSTGDPSTTTTSFSGSLTRKTSSRSFVLTTGSGTLTGSVSFSKAKTLSLSLRRPDGSVVASTTGRSPSALQASVVAGSYTLVVTDSTNASFTVAVTYPAP